MREALRVMKPGAHGLVWALPRTSHWPATALENAGFEIRDVHHHIFGTGFPKSLNIGEGRGTALKPAAEHWILVRKPLAGTVAANVLEHGTGALNIDACRIAATDKTPAPVGQYSRPNVGTVGHTGYRDGSSDHLGRWPAHLSLDEEAAAMLDEQSGHTKSGGGLRRATALGQMNDDGWQPTAQDIVRPTDSGGASRFFYVAKPSRSERDLGCEALPERTAGEATDREEGSAGLSNPRAGAGRTGGAKNFHPTVKSQALMRWLIRLITPPGGTVLDLFAGSCSTGVAALAEGCEFLGVELDIEYIEIAKARLEHAIKEAA